MKMHPLASELHGKAKLLSGPVRQARLDQLIDLSKENLEQVASVFFYLEDEFNKVLTDRTLLDYKEQTFYDYAVNNINSKLSKLEEYRNLGPETKNIILALISSLAKKQDILEKYFGKGLSTFDKNENFKKIFAISPEIAKSDFDLELGLGVLNVFVKDSGDVLSGDALTTTKRVSGLHTSTVRDGETLYFNFIDRASLDGDEERVANTKRHEHAHAINSFLMFENIIQSDSDEFSMAILRAKDEIIAQFAGGRDAKYVRHIMSNREGPYNFFGTSKKHKELFDIFEDLNKKARQINNVLSKYSHAEYIRIPELNMKTIKTEFDSVTAALMTLRIVGGTKYEVLKDEFLNLFKSADSKLASYKKDIDEWSNYVQSILPKINLLGKLLDDAESEVERRRILLLFSMTPFNRWKDFFDSKYRVE